MYSTALAERANDTYACTCQLLWWSRTYKLLTWYVWSISVNIYVLIEFWPYITIMKRRLQYIYKTNYNLFHFFFHFLQKTTKLFNSEHQKIKIVYFCSRCFLSKNWYQETAPVGPTLYTKAFAQMTRCQDGGNRRPSLKPEHFQ